jgi:hypothetical protein
VGGSLDGFECGGGGGKHNSAIAGVE